MTHVAAAIIKDAEGRILICQRGTGGSCAYLWEFPGGKLEEGESPEDCLVRECREELALDVKVQKIFAETEYEYPDQTIHFTFFTAEICGGRIRTAVHQDLRWARPEELKDYAFCPADVGVAEKLGGLEVIRKI